MRSQALLGRDHVDDPVQPLHRIEIGETVGAGVLSQEPHLRLAHRVVEAGDIAAGGDRVIGAGEGPFEMGHAEAPLSLEGLRAADLVHQVQVDRQRVLAGRHLAHLMDIEDLVVERASRDVPQSRSRAMAAARSGFSSSPKPGASLGRTVPSVTGQVSE